MDHFTSDGVFWLPGARHRRLPGKLTFDADGVDLLLYASLEELVIPPNQSVGIDPEWKTIPVVHGRLHDGREMTLLDVTGISMPGPFDDVHEQWSVAFALTGGLSIETDYYQARFGFDALMAWADPDGIAVDGDTRSSVVVDVATTTLAQTIIVGGTELRLLTGGSGTWDHSRVTLEQWCAFEANTSDPLPVRRILNEWVRPLQDLLIVCLGRPVRLTSLYLRPRGADPRADSLAVSFAAVQPPPSSPPTLTQVDDYNAPTLLTRNSLSVPLPDLLRGWYDVHAAQRDAITLLCGPYYAPFIYGEHHFASTFQAAEALARQEFDTRDKPKEEHRERIAAVTAALEQAGLDPEVVTWATNVLKARNDKPLARLIEELAVATGEMGQRILGVAPQFPRDVAWARTGVSHGGAEGTAAIPRFWLGEALTWIVRASLLHRAGIPVAALAQRAIGKPRFMQALRELAAES